MIIPILILIIFLLILGILIIFFMFTSKTVYARKKTKIKYTDKEKSALDFIDTNAKDIAIITSDSKKIKLTGKMLKQENPTNKWAIIVHGHTRYYESVCSIAKDFYDKGFNILTPNLRGHGPSGGKITTMGIMECQDMLCWIELILKEDKNANIILHGTSLGAGTVMNTIGLKSECLKNVKAVIEDCGFTSIYSEFENLIKSTYKLLPTKLTMNIINSLCKLIYGIDFKSVEPIKMIQNSNIPILFIHGDKDTYVPFYMLDQLYNVYNGPKEKLIVKDAKHAEASNILGDEYSNIIMQFIKKYTNI